MRATENGQRNQRCNEKNLVMVTGSAHDQL